MRKVLAYKLARTDGWDFYTGKTINYRDFIGKVVKCPNPNPKLGVCSRGVIHASKNSNDCFVGARIPCSAYRVEGKPACGDKTKWGFTELYILEEIKDLDALFGWQYSKAINPINPLSRKVKPTKSDIALLKEWASVRASVGVSVWDSVRASVRVSVWVSVRDSVWASVGDSVWDSVGASVGDSVWDSVGAYIGRLFPNIKEWKYIKHKKGVYPYQPVVDLWERGLVPSFDGSKWLLHSGKKADIVFEITKQELLEVK